MAATIDEIREKYQCDKRQTGQVVNASKFGMPFKNLQGADKNRVRNFNRNSQGVDPLTIPLEKRKDDIKKKALVKEYLKACDEEEKLAEKRRNLGKKLKEMGLSESYRTLKEQFKL